jgi:hypothetical protein
MSKLLSNAEVIAQSKTVFGQFGESVWIPNAKKNVQLPHKDAAELLSCGIGKVMVLVGMGSSLEDQVEVISKYRDRCDVCVCDKGFGPLLDHGVKADYVFLCDANIPFRYIAPYIDKTDGVGLIATPYANPEWTTPWKGDRYIFVMRDAIESEQHFFPIFGNLRGVPAGSNVSNGMLTFFAGCDEKSDKNWAGYEKYLLIGYDYSWPREGNYYAWMNPIEKRHYMTHRTILDIAMRPCFTSENLYFSAKWMVSYLSKFDIPVSNCGGRGLLMIPGNSTLEKELSRLKPKEFASKIVRQSFETLRLMARTYEESKKAFNMAREAIWA